MLSVNFTPNSIWSTFRSILSDAIERYVPIGHNPAPRGSRKKERTIHAKSGVRLIESLVFGTHSKTTPPTLKLRHHTEMRSYDVGR
jgi:hypothetical protein